MNIGALFGAALPWMPPLFNPTGATPGINPTPNMIPPAQPQGGGFASRLNSPLSQIGLSILANSPGSGALRGIGQGVLGYQQQQRSTAEEELKRKYMEAQIQRMQQPEQDNAAPMVVMGPDGKPRYVSRRDAIGQSPYEPQNGNVSGPGELAIAQALNDPNTPAQVKKDLRELLARKYPGPQAQEPLVAIQTPDGRSILVPRSQAAGATPAAPRENFVPQEGERVAANFYGRMEAAESKLGDYVPSAMDYFAADKVMSSGPIGASAFNKMLSIRGQSYYQAAADWVRAKLRKESGAVISPEEMAQEIKQYFPLPGDDQQTVAQKAQARREAMSGMRDMGGRAVKQPSATPNNSADPLGIR